MCPTCAIFVLQRLHGQLFSIHILILLFKTRERVCTIAYVKAVLKFQQNIIKVYIQFNMHLSFIKFERIRWNAHQYIVAFVSFFIFFTLCGTADIPGRLLLFGYLLGSLTMIVINISEDSLMSFVEISLHCEVFLEFSFLTSLAMMDFLLHSN